MQVEQSEHKIFGYFAKSIPDEKRVKKISEHEKMKLPK
jgi:hypothetical protein